MGLSREIERAIGAMVMVGVRGLRAGGAALERDLDDCAAAGVGGVILFDRDVATGGVRNVESVGQVRDLVMRVRVRLGEDVLIAVDQEGGRVARLRAEHGFEETVSAGRFSGLHAAERACEAARLARSVASVGIDVNFAPCIDLALDPGSSVIAGLERSYSDDAAEVAACAGEVIEAHRREGVRTCVKHFPGHGSSRGDTHEGLVDITDTWREEEELEPYRRLLAGSERRKPWAVMTGHLVHRGVDSGWPASLSRAWTTGVLRERLGWDGVVVTDSLEMGAIVERCSLEEAVVLAVNAGADVVLHGNNGAGGTDTCPASRMVEAITRAVVDGGIEGGNERVLESVRRIKGIEGSRDQVV